MRTSKTDTAPKRRTSRTQKHLRGKERRAWYDQCIDAEDAALQTLREVIEAGADMGDILDGNADADAERAWVDLQNAIAASALAAHDLKFEAP